MRRSQGIQVALAILIIAVFTISSAPVNAQRTEPGPVMPETFRQNSQYEIAILFCMETDVAEPEFLVMRNYKSSGINGNGGGETDARCADAIAMYIQMGWMMHTTEFYQQEDRNALSILWKVPIRPMGSRWSGDDQ